MVEIRDADDGDERALRDLDAATWSPLISPGPPPDPREPFLARFGTAAVLVAVDPRRQGEGIGSRLLAAGIDRVRAEGRRRLFLRVLATNTPARRLYERHGFAVEGSHRDAFLLEGAYVDDLLMALDLNSVTAVGIDGTELDPATAPGRRLSHDDRDAIAAALVARLHDEGRTQAYGEIILPAGAPAAGRRRARTSPAPPAAGRGRPASVRPG